MLLFTLKIDTDMTNIDTDEDGLDDYYEIKISKTNPLSKDTDGNGINEEMNYLIKK